MVLEAFIRRCHFSNQSDATRSCLSNCIRAVWVVIGGVEHCVISKESNGSPREDRDVISVKRYSVGARQDPWGTPARTARGEESWSSMRTQKQRFDKNDEIVLMIHGGMFKVDILYMRPSCQTLSNAFSTSRNTDAVDWRRLEFHVLREVPGCDLTRDHLS